MSDVTRLIDAAAAGDPEAAADFMQLVFDELCQLTSARMACEGPGQFLDATALVHEGYPRPVLCTRLSLRSTGGSSHET